MSHLKQLLKLFPLQLVHLPMLTQGIKSQSKTSNFLPIHTLSQLSPLSSTCLCGFSEKKFNSYVLSLAIQPFIFGKFSISIFYKTFIKVLVSVNCVTLVEKSGLVIHLRNLARLDHRGDASNILTNNPSWSHL